jgi:hypothetical protein
MCETSKTPQARDGHVLVADRRVLDRHLPARERHEPGARRNVPVVKRRALERG